MSDNQEYITLLEYKEENGLRINKGIIVIASMEHDRIQKLRDRYRSIEDAVGIVLWHTFRFVHYPMDAQMKELVLAWHETLLGRAKGNDAAFLIPIGNTKTIQAADEWALGRRGQLGSLLYQHLH